MKRAQNGFTIIELVIVIAVISILATISIVAYNGAQSRARNAQTYTAARAYYETFNAYKAQNGRYPALSTETIGSCLGTTYNPNKCALLPLDNIHMDTQVNNELKTYLDNNLPMPGIPPKGDWSGIWYLPATQYTPFTLDGVRTSFIIYAVEGSNSTCEVGPVASSKIVSGQQSGFEFLSAEPANKRTLDNASGTPTCWMALK